MIRNESVDFFKVIGIIAVISIHTSPFGGVSSPIYYEDLNIVLNQTARFAVPFFFIISGYFWGIKIKDKQQCLPYSIKIINRLFLVFMFWSFVYILPYRPENFGEVEYVYSRVLDIINNPVSAALTGTRVHLWFLVSLGFSVFITSLFLYFKAVKSLIIFAVLLYMLDLSAKAYVETPLGIDFGIKSITGPLKSTIFFVTGFMLSKIKSNDFNLKYGLLVMVIGYILHFSEMRYLYTMYGVNQYHVYLFGTYFMGLGVALVALSNHPIFYNTILSNLGKYVLGIYVIHMLYIDILKTYDLQYNFLIWEIGYVFIVFLLSFVSVYVLSRFKFMKSVLI